jgi:thymidylate kinase
VGKSMGGYRMVHFFGPDGAGKTTQVAKLAARVETQGATVHKTWVRSPHTLAFVATRLLYRLGLHQRFCNPCGHMIVSRPRVDQNRVSKFLWVVLELVSVLPVVLREAVIPALRGHALIAERYLLDSVATIAFFLQDEGFVNSWAARFLYRLIPRDTLLVYLDADYPSILERRGEIAEPEEFIAFQRRVYGILAARMRALVIYTPDHTIEETHAIICSALTAASAGAPRKSGAGARLESVATPKTVMNGE